MKKLEDIIQEYFPNSKIIVEAGDELVSIKVDEAIIYITSELKWELELMIISDSILETIVDEIERKRNPFKKF